MELDTATALVNAALSHRKTTTGKSWEALAEELGVDQATVHRWRSGDLGKGTKVLVQLVAEICACEPTNLPV